MNDHHPTVSQAEAGETSIDRLARSHMILAMALLGIRDVCRGYGHDERLRLVAEFAAVALGRAGIEEGAPVEAVLREALGGESSADGD